MKRLRHRPLAARLRRLGAGERLLAIAMLAVVAGALGLIAQGMWLKLGEGPSTHVMVHAPNDHAAREASGPLLP